MKIITLGGFGDFSENEDGLKELAKIAKKYEVQLYPTYYDYELKGKQKDIEAVTMELYAMSREQWSENALTETEI